MTKKYTTQLASELQITTTGYQDRDEIVFEEAGAKLELGDGGEEVEKMFSEEQKNYLLSVLTNRQQQVAVLLFNGYNRPDIARNLTPPVCVQAVHQIILRIRKRMNKKAKMNIPSRHTKHGHI